MELSGLAGGLIICGALALIVAFYLGRDLD